MGVWIHIFIILKHVCILPFQSAAASFVSIIEFYDLSFYTNDHNVLFMYNHNNCKQYFYKSKYNVLLKIKGWHYSNLYKFIDSVDFTIIFVLTIYSLKIGNVVDKAWKFCRYRSLTLHGINELVWMKNRIIGVHVTEINIFKYLIKSKH